MPKREPSSEPSKPAKKARTKAPAPKKDDGRKTGTWSPDELKLLYEIMCPKRGVNWSEVAAALPGRDAKSCNNKWTRMQPKIMAAVMGLAEQ